MLPEQLDKENVMANPTKPEAFQDEAMDDIQGAGPKLQEAIANGTFYPETSPLHAARKPLSQDSFSINFAKIDVPPK